MMLSGEQLMKRLAPIIIQTTEKPLTKQFPSLIYNIIVFFRIPTLTTVNQRVSV